MERLLVVDKSVFEATSTCELGEFAQNHFVILPDVLYFECATTDRNKERLLDRFRSAILSGAYICPSCTYIIKNEDRRLCPYGFLVDLRNVAAVRKTFQKNSRPYRRRDAQEKLKQELDMARQVLSTADGFTKELTLNDPKLLSKARKWDSSKSARYARLMRWTEYVDAQNMHDSAKIMLNDITEHVDKFCLSDKWITWHFLRLMHILIQERTFLRQSGDASSEKVIEHDLQDIKYILLLSRAYGLLIKDEGCSSLARAAFPEKDVFSSLDEVPDEYRCDWS